MGYDNKDESPVRCKECGGTKFANGEHIGDVITSNPPRICSHDKEKVNINNLPDWAFLRAYCGC
jgi:hypothetical protein